MGKEIFGERVNHGSYIAQVFLNNSLSDFFCEHFELMCLAMGVGTIPYKSCFMLLAFLIANIFKNYAGEKETIFPQIRLIVSYYGKTFLWCNQDLKRVKWYMKYVELYNVIAIRMSFELEPRDLGSGPYSLSHY